MEEGRPSRTAIAAAMGRAAHLLLDGGPKIFEDPLALGLSGFENEAALRVALNRQQAELAQRLTPERVQALLLFMRVNPALRQRYTEDELSQAVERGVAQYVILGAGLDSFAYRRPDLTAVVRVFEVDCPATQQWKRARLRELNIALPSNLTFVPLDFERQTLGEGLPASGHRRDLPTFFSWLGVTMFLTEAAVFETLSYVASMAPGSEIVFEYGILNSLLDRETRQLTAVLEAFVAARGEPVRSLFDPVALATRVKELGFTQVWDFGPEEAAARYFAGRTDGLAAPKLGWLMKARV